jgi:hypothetical protein
MTFVVWMRLAEVPDTVMVKAPCGVPPGYVGGGFVVTMLELLPPQDVHSNAIGKATAAANRRRLRGTRASLARRYIQFLLYA